MTLKRQTKLQGLIWGLGRAPYGSLHSAKVQGIYNYFENLVAQELFSQALTSLRRSIPLDMRELRDLGHGLIWNHSDHKRPVV